MYEESISDGYHVSENIDDALSGNFVDLEKAQLLHEFSLSTINDLLSDNATDVISSNKDAVNHKSGVVKKIKSLTISETLALTENKRRVEFCDYKCGPRDSVSQAKLNSYKLAKNTDADYGIYYKLPNDNILLPDILITIHCLNNAQSNKGGKKTDNNKLSNKKGLAAGVDSGGDTDDNSDMPSSTISRNEMSSRSTKILASFRTYTKKPYGNKSGGNKNNNGNSGGQKTKTSSTFKKGKAASEGDVDEDTEDDEDTTTDDDTEDENTEDEETTTEEEDSEEEYKYEDSDDDSGPFNVFKKYRKGTKSNIDAEDDSDEDEDNGSDGPDNIYNEDKSAYRRVLEAAKRNQKKKK